MCPQIIGRVRGITRATSTLHARDPASHQPLLQNQALAVWCTPKTPFHPSLSPQHKNPFVVFLRGHFCPHKGLFHFARSLSHFALCSRALPPNAPQPTSLVSLLTRHRPAHMAGCRRPSTPLGVVSNVSSLFFQSTKHTLKFPQLQPAPRPRHPRPNMPRYACTALVADPGSRACATSWDGWLTGRF